MKKERRGKRIFGIFAFTLLFLMIVESVFAVDCTKTIITKPTTCNSALTGSLIAKADYNYDGTCKEIPCTTPNYKKYPHCSLDTRTDIGWIAAGSYGKQASIWFVLNTPKVVREIVITGSTCMDGSCNTPRTLKVQLGSEVIYQKLNQINKVILNTDYNTPVSLVNLTLSASSQNSLDEQWVVKEVTLYTYDDYAPETADGFDNDCDGLKDEIVFGNSLDNQLTAYWSFDIDDGSTNVLAKDKLGLSDSVVYNLQPAEHVSGRVGEAYYFDGINNYIGTAKASSVFFKNNAKTLALFESTEGTAPSATSPYKGQALAGDTGGFFGLYRTVVGGLDKLWAYNWDGTEDKTGSLYDNNKWQHIIVAHDGANLKIYKNCILQDSAASGSTTDVSKNFRIGVAYGATPVYFKGKLDEVATWNRVLTPAEITSLCAFYPPMAVCGNGDIEQDELGWTEECDDGNLINGDGCTSSCYIEPYIYFSYWTNSTTPEIQIFSANLTNQINLTISGSKLHSMDVEYTIKNKTGEIISVFTRRVPSSSEDFDAINWTADFSGVYYFEAKLVPTGQIKNSEDISFRVESKLVNCNSTFPENAKWNSARTSDKDKFNQTRNLTDWVLGTKYASYNSAPGDCNFVCVEGYSWDEINEKCAVAGKSYCSDITDDDECNAQTPFNARLAMNELEYAQMKKCGEYTDCEEGRAFRDLISDCYCEWDEMFGCMVTRSFNQALEKPCSTPPESDICSSYTFLGECVSSSEITNTCDANLQGEIKVKVTTEWMPAHPENECRPAECADTERTFSCIPEEKLDFWTDAGIFLFIAGMIAIYAFLARRQRID